MEPAEAYPPERYETGTPEGARDRSPGGDSGLPISLNYTAVLNILFTIAGAALIWLTIRRGATDPVCGMRVDRQATERRVEHAGRSYFFCSPGCREEFEADPGRQVG